MVSLSYSVSRRSLLFFAAVAALGCGLPNGGGAQTAAPDPVPSNAIVAQPPTPPAPSTGTTPAPAASPADAASASPFGDSNKPAPYAVRLANAKSVVVLSSILGVELGTTVKRAHEILDKRSQKKFPPKEEGGKDEDARERIKEDLKRPGKRRVAKESERERDNPDTDEEKKKTGEPDEDAGEEHKILWRLASSDYAAVFVKADDNDKIDYIFAQLRPGKEIPFDKIGEPVKAPLQSTRTIAWDVIRPNHPGFRVVARGAERKASGITIFVVKRAGDQFRTVIAPPIQVK